MIGIADGSDANGKSFQLFPLAPPTVTWANYLLLDFEKIVEIKNPNLFQDRDLSWPTRANTLKLHQTKKNLNKLIYIGIRFIRQNYNTSNNFVKHHKIAYFYYVYYYVIII